MSKKLTKFFYFSLFSSILSTILCSTLVPQDFESSISNKYKSNLEFHFEKNYNPELMNFATIEGVEKYFHTYKNSFVNMSSGSKFKCYIPKKINKGSEILKKEDLIDNIDEELANYLLRENSKMCYNSSFKDWFYKLCPFSTATQMLSYKKKNEEGLEYTEIFMLGTKNSTEYNIENYYRNKTGDNESINLPKIPYIVVNDKIGKIYNYDKDAFKKYDIAVEINYPKQKIEKFKELKINLYNKTVEDFMKENPEAQYVPVQRKIIKLINKHLVFFNSAFPFPTFQYNFNFNVIREKKRELLNNNNLLVYGDMIYCQKCEFLLYYNVGDTLFIKNNKFTESRRLDFQKKIFQGRFIIGIYDNTLIRVHKNFEEEYSGLIPKKNYFVVSSEFKQYKYKFGSGIIKFYQNLMFGDDTNFLREVDEDDVIIPIDYNLINENSENFSQNLKKNYFINYCRVEKIFSKSMLFTNSPCKKIYKFKGDYLIRKKYNQYSSNVLFDNTNTYDMYIGKSLKSEIEELNKRSENSIENYFAPIDLDTIEVLNINKKFKTNLENHFFFNYGYIIKNLGNTVFRFKVEKINSGKSRLNIYFGTKITNYLNKLHSIDDDYELIIDSNKGIIFKKIKSDNPDEIEFYTNEIKSFFQESTYLELILKDNHIYLNTIDDDKESSIKIKYTFPFNQTIKYIYFDAFDSENISIKDMKKINFIESKYLINIYIFEIRLRLSPDIKFTEKLELGDYCENINRYRSSIIEYRCDPKGINEITIEKVIEPSMCEYKYLVKTRNLCNPLFTMYSKIQNSVATTKCIIQNDEFNKNSEDYFEKA